MKAPGPHEGEPGTESQPGSCAESSISDRRAAASANARRDAHVFADRGYPVFPAHRFDDGALRHLATTDHDEIDALWDNDLAPLIGVVIGGGEWTVTDPVKRPPEPKAATGYGPAQSHYERYRWRSILPLPARKKTPPPTGYTRRCRVYGCVSAHDTLAGSVTVVRGGES